MTSALATVVATIIVYKTYSKWLSAKKREDAYQTSKDYIFSLVAMSELLDELMSIFDRAVPQAGGIPINSNQSQPLLASSNESFHDLTFQTKKLIRTKLELGFWGVDLTHEFVKAHDQLLNEMQGVLVISSALQSQINWYYNVKQDNQAAMLDELIN